MRTLNLVGAGRVGQTLGQLFAGSHEVRLGSLCTRSAASAQAAANRLGAGTPVDTLAAMNDADIWFLAVPDSQIAPCALALAQLHHQPAIAFHASGALSSAELAPLAARGWKTASVHCLLSFAHPQRAISQFPGTLCACEGDVNALEVLEPMFQAVNGKCFRLAAQNKLAYHAAAVWATNFLPVLVAQAATLWREAGMPAEWMVELQERLLRNAVNNILELGPAAAVTGPAARGDWALVEAQVELMSARSPDAAAAYRALSAMAHQLAASGELSSPG